MVVENETLFSGARATLVLRGVEFADLTGCSGSWRYDRRPYKPCGRLTVQEHLTVGKFVDFSCTRAKRLDQDLTELGLEGHDIPTMLAKEVLTAIVRDEFTGKPIYMVTGVELASCNFSFDDASQVIENITFVARDIQTELEIAQP